MNARLYAALEAKMDEWIDEFAEDVNWPDVFVGQRTAEMMARASAAVFDACAESQEHAQRQGYLHTRGEAHE